MNLPNWAMVAILTVCSPIAQAQSSRGPEYQSHLAHVSAANASLRLHETAEARGCLLEIRKEKF